MIEVLQFLGMVAGVALLVFALLLAMQLAAVALFVVEGLPALVCAAWRKARGFWEP